MQVSAKRLEFTRLQGGAPFRAPRGRRAPFSSSAVRRLEGRARIIEFHEYPQSGRGHAPAPVVSSSREGKKISEAGACHLPDCGFDSIEALPQGQPYFSRLSRMNITVAWN